MNAELIFIRMKHFFLKNQKKNFFNPTNIQFSISNNFKACKSEINDAKLMDVAQPVWFSGCPQKGNFSAQKAFLVFLAIK